MTTDIPARNRNAQARVEADVDYEQAARLANRAFAEASRFDATHMRWMYERSFSRGGTIVSLEDENQKVGQIAMVRQDINVDGIAETAVQLIDLFILDGYRSSGSIAALYAEVERQCRIQDIRFAIGMPNAKAIGVNTHFFQLKSYRWLDIRAGVSIASLLSPSLILNETFGTNRDEAYELWLDGYRTSAAENGMVWSGAKFVERLANPRYAYGLHAVESLLLISSPRQRRGTPYLLVCGLFQRQGFKASVRDIRAVVRAACNHWRRPLFVFPGFNELLPSLPGWVLPNAIRPSTMLLQLRDFKPDRAPLRLDRYQPIDFDFA